MTKPKSRRIRQVLALAPVLLGLALTSQVAYASAFVGGTYDQRCLVYPGILCVPPPYPKGIPAGPSFALDQTYHGENFYWLDGVTTTADTHLFVDASPAAYHALSDTAISFSMNPPIHALPVEVTFSTGGLYLDGQDVIHFNSPTLAPGTPISFEISETLHSTISGPCGASPSGPAAYASFRISAGGWYAPSLYHTGCGDGSDRMTATTILSSTVGGEFTIVSNFQIWSISGFGSNLEGLSAFTNAHVVDASSTGAVYISILTPGVTLTSDSGASYHPSHVPEPGSAALLCAGCLFLAARAVGRRAR